MSRDRTLGLDIIYLEHLILISNVGIFKFDAWSLKLMDISFFLIRQRFYGYHGELAMPPEIT